MTRTGDDGTVTGGTADAGRGVFICSDGHREPWRLRRSSRARHARLTVSPREGLTVVLPQRSHARPERYLEELRPQVERMLEKVRPQREAYLASLDAPLPTTLELPGAGEVWDIEYQPTGATRITARESGATLRLSGDVDDRAACERALRSFVLRRAKVALPELLEASAPELGIAYAECRVSAARKRWGSCSSDGRIMLSAQLLFLPPELVFHVICHELVHIEHMDHSQAFHARLDRIDPDSAAHERALRDAGVYVPAWMTTVG
jgi:predicted metal-dependent hydrolase